MSRIDLTKTQLALFFVILLLAVDSINPVKIFLHVFPSVKAWHIASLSMLLIVYVFISEMKDILYFSVKIFFHSILSIFFREVQIIGKDNIPRYGPVIFTSNHANQFMDGIAILCTCEHNISYLVAEKSWNRRIIGDVAWAMGAVPVKRAQDSAKRGSGIIKIHPALPQDTKEDVPGSNGESAKDASDTRRTPSILRVSGDGTEFTTQLRLGDKTRLPGTALGLKVTKIEDDDHLEVELPHEQMSELAIPEHAVEYDILKRVDQKDVYEAVLDKLASGGAIGIFPEGGSHDRTDLLPLKVGVALIAYTALEKDGINVPIIPVGLNYFEGHRFRGRAIVEYGRPTYIDPSTLDAYNSGGMEKRRVCNELLERIQDSMKSVIVSTKDYETLQIIHTARRLYQWKEQTASEKQDLSRRFAEGYRQLMLQVEGHPPKEWLDLQERLVDYQNELNDLGIKDYQVPGLDHEKYELDGDVVLREMRLPYQIAHVVLLLLLALLPAVFLNLPVGLVARRYSERKRKAALAKSKVKLKALDVMLSEKVLLCIVLVPSLWFTYGILLYFFSNLDGQAIALAILSMPLFSYTGIMIAEAGMVDIKDLRPHVMRLFPSARRRLAALPATRMKLQADLRQFVRELGPSLGDIYYGKDLDWKSIQEKVRLDSPVPKESKKLK